MSKPLLGTILIESQTCKPEEVELALRRQRELAERNHYKHLGAILLEMDLVTLTQLHRALERQKLDSRKATS